MELGDLCTNRWLRWLVPWISFWRGARYKWRVECESRLLRTRQWLCSRCGALMWLMCRWVYSICKSFGVSLQNVRSFFFSAVRCKYFSLAVFSLRGSTKVSFIDTIAHFVVYNARGTQPELIDRVCTVSHFLGIVSKNFLENFLQTPRYNFSHLVDRPCKKEGDFVLNTVILNNWYLVE